MRKVLLFTLGFAAVCAVAAYLFSGAALILLGLICGLLWVLCCFLKHRAAGFAALMLLGCAAGSFYCLGYEQLILLPASAYDGQTLRVQVEATDYSFDTDYGTAVDGKVRLDGRQWQIRLYMDRDDVKPGDVLTGDVRLRFTGNGGIQDTTYHKAQGIFLLGYAEDSLQVERPEKIPGKYFIPQFQKYISKVIDEAFKEENTAGFSLALLLGDDRDLSFADDAAFQISGIRHVIAVSGLHVSILFGFVYMMTGRRRGLTALIGLPLLLFFCALAGFTPSVVRACVMQALMILAVLVDKEYDPPTALAFSALVMLVCNPMVITSVGFQLSVGCMIGIFAFSGKIRRVLLGKRWGGRSLLNRFVRFLISSASVTVSAMTVTVPLCAFYFGMVSLIGIVTNILTLWVISFIFYGLMAVVLAGAIDLSLAQILAWLISWPIRYVLETARLLSAVPFGTVYVQSVYVVLWIVLSYALFGLFLLSKKKRPWQLCGGIAVLLVLALTASWAEPRMDNFRMTVLNVGQGQCILLTSKDESYLIDCGGDDSEKTALTAVRTLRCQGIFQLDGIILTHFDEDHAGAVPYLLQLMEVKTLYLPDAEENSQIRKQLEEQGTDIQWVTEEERISCGTGEMSLFPALEGTSGNESSMCILFRAENCDILITGDRNLEGEHALLQQTDLPDIEVLVAGHHGADTSTGLELLWHTRPEVAVISVGEGNIYGHPARETLQRLSRIGCQVRRTDREGTIIIRG